MNVIRYFIKVIQFGSFSKAAVHLQVPKSTLSKAISKLEKETGTVLLVRTTRSLTLTAAGRSLFESCLEPLQKIEDAQRSLSSHDKSVSGTVRLTAPEDLGSEIIAPSLAQLMNQHPSLTLDLHYSDEMMDLVRDGFDLAVRIGRLQESRLKVKKIGEVSLSLVASPKYLQHRAKVRHPRDLEHHQLLSMKVYATQQRWRLESAKHSIQVKIKPRVVCNQMTSLLQMAIADGGIALIPTFLCHRPVEEKKVVYVLPEWQHPGAPVSLISPLSTATSARLQVVAETLIKDIRNSLSKEIY